MNTGLLNWRRLMKANILLKRVLEKAEGELEIPKYDDLDTPNNHLKPGDMKKVSNPQKNLGKKMDKKSNTDVGEPGKESRDLEGPKMVPQRMKESSIKEQRTINPIYDALNARIIRGRDGKGRLYVQHPTVRGFNFQLEITPSLKELLVAASTDERNLQDPARTAAVLFGKLKRIYDGQREQARAVGEGSGYGAQKTPKASKCSPSKSVSVRTKQPDEPKVKGDVGKPKNKGRDGEVKVSVTKMKARGTISEQVKDLEKLLETNLDFNMNEGRLLSAKKLFAFLDEVTQGKGRFQELGLKHPKISDETYGRESNIYIHTGSPQARQLLEKKLKEAGFRVREDYYPGSGTVEVRVSYFKGFHWDEDKGKKKTRQDSRRGTLAPTSASPGVRG
jgi:hypothetical protein